MNAATLEVATVQKSSDLLDRLDTLLNNDADGLHVSIYCPAGRLPHEARAAKIAFKNQVGKVTEELERAGNAEAGQVLGRLEEMLPMFANKPFWNRQLGGVAVFVNNERCEVFEVAAPLAESSRVGYDFRLKPLLALGSNLNIYHLLAISQNDVKFYRGSALGLREIPCPGLAGSYAKAIAEIGYSDHSKKQAAVESNLKTGEEETRVFLRHLEHAVSRYLSKRDSPLIVTGDRVYDPIYRDVNTYPNLSERYIEGNPERRSTEELAELAQEMLRRDFTESQRLALLRFKDFDEAPVDRVAKDLEAVLNASIQGKVESVFLPADADVWGTFDPDEGKTTLSKTPSVTDDELYEWAARQVLANGGEVFFLEERQLPTNSKAIAVLRWEDPSLSSSEN